MDKQTEYCVIPSPLGPLGLEAAAGRLVGCVIATDSPLVPPATPLLSEAARQLGEYFFGQRREFDLPLDPCGGATPFRERVWRRLCEIPYGATASYAEVAAGIGEPRACRAVAVACHHNPLPIFIPCHRVIGADGSLTGYACGLAIKRFLLDLERRGEGQ